MTVIIGSATIVDAPSIWAQGGIISVSYSFTPGMQRLWQIGSFDPFDVFISYVSTLEITAYGRRFDGFGGSALVDVSPTDRGCEDASSHEITVSPATCLEPSDAFQGTYYVTAYSYQKPAFGYGIESWSFTSEPTYGQNPYIPPVPPSIGHRATKMIRGIAEGTMSVGQGYIEFEEFVGVRINNNASNFPSAQAVPVITTEGSVTAGPDSLGSHEKTRSIVVTDVGKSMGNNDQINGIAGQVSINIPITPVYI